LTCDHDATRASLTSFFAGAKLIGAMIDGEGGWMLLACCKECDSTLAIAITEVRASVIASGEIQGREPWNERGNESNEGSRIPSPESSGPVPAEKLTSTEITKVSGLGAATAAQPTRGQRRISAGRMGRHLEDLDDETPEELARRLIK
jgi:hypothetical protein